MLEARAAMVMLLGMQELTRFFKSGVDTGSSRPADAHRLPRASPALLHDDRMSTFRPCVVR